jgi:hypothetical protein
LGSPKPVYIRANRRRILWLSGSSSIARLASSRALSYWPNPIYAAARLLRYVADDGWASIASDAH